MRFGLGSKNKLKDQGSVIPEQSLRISELAEAGNEACRGHDLGRNLPLAGVPHH